MEDIYTIKVKTKPDRRNLYPSERRYSASTVSGLAWVHIALAATSFLLALLALINPNSDIKRLNLNDTEQKTVNTTDLFFDYDINALEINNETDSKNDEKRDNSYILVLASTLITIFALAAGIASIMASVRWYINRNITWLLIMSILSTIVALISFLMVFIYLIISENEVTEKIENKNYFIVKLSDIIEKNNSHMVIKHAPTTENDNESHLFTKKVLSINILIAAFLELLWSVLSVKISYKGMRNNYKDDDERRGNCISVVTTIKGNNTKRLPKKFLPPKPDLIRHYPSTKIKKIFFAQSENGFYLKNQNQKAKNTETSSEFYKERMMNFLNKCASLEGISNPEVNTPSVQSENVLNTIPEVTTAEIYVAEKPEAIQETSVSPVSWGDSPDHTIYNQNTLNFDKIFNFNKPTIAQEELKESDQEIREQDTLKVHNNSEQSIDDKDVEIQE